MDVFDIIVNYRQAIIAGLKVTLKLCLIIWSFGFLAGSALGIAGAKWVSTAGRFCRFGAFVLSGLPVLVLLFWLHYPLQKVLGVIIDPFYTAAFTLSIINVFAVGGVVYHALTGFPSQYIVAANVYGLSSNETLRYIQFPIITRQIIPGLLVAQVQMLQATLFASLISVEEIFRIAQRINSEVYRPVEVYTALGLMFLLICLPLNYLAQHLEQRSRDLSEK